MSAVISIGNRKIGGDHPAFIIAEIGANHNGDMSLAKKLILAAKETGCDCAKFQTFTAETFCADKRKTFTYRSQGKEVTESEYEMFKRLEFTRDQWEEIIEFCQENDILFMTTVQDPPNLQMMLELGLPAIKVGSDDFDFVDNLKLYAQTGLPLIVSKGMADLAEVDRVLKQIQPLAQQLAVLHCVSLYPADPKFLNLKQIQTLSYLYPDIVWGFSDHSQGTLASSLAVGLGAKIIEKHFTLDHDLPGPDHWFSMDVAQMRQLVSDIRTCELSLGTGRVEVTAEERKSKKIMRRRIVANRPLRPGETIDSSTVTFKRSEQGEFIQLFEVMNGARLKVSKNPNEGIALSDLEFT